MATRAHRDPPQDLRDRLLRLLGVGRLPVPVGVELHPGHALALDRLGHDRRRLAGRRHRFVHRVQDGGVVVAVDLDRVPAERPELLGERGEIHDLADPAGLLDLIVVDDHAEVVERELRRAHRRLPDLAGLRLAVADHAPHPALRAVQFSCDRHTDRDREPLAERAGRGLDPGHAQPVDVALQSRLELAERLQPVVREEPGSRERDVERRRAVALRQHEAVAIGPGRLGRAVSQDPAEVEADQRVDRGKGAAGVTRAGLGDRLDDVDAQLAGQLPELVGIERLRRFDHLRHERNLPGPGGRKPILAARAGRRPAGYFATEASRRRHSR